MTACGTLSDAAGHVARLGGHVSGGAAEAQGRHDAGSAPLSPYAISATSLRHVFYDPTPCPLSPYAKFAICLRHFRYLPTPSPLSHDTISPLSLRHIPSLPTISPLPPYAASVMCPLPPYALTMPCLNLIERTRWYR
eukprot:3077581-Rhodomonas_salina.1